MKSRTGYTLLELSIVLVVLALMAGFYLSTKTATTIDEKRVLTETRMARIQEALLAYRLANHSLPCPSDATIQMGQANFGVAGTATTCTGANFSTASIAAGALPTRTLGLSDEYMFDGWNRRFTYGLTKVYSTACAFAADAVTSTAGAIIVHDTSGAQPRTLNGIYIVVSHGPNGHGAYTAAGSRFQSSTNGDDLQNCHCTVNATNGTFDEIFIDRAPTLSPTDMLNRYDDIVRYATRTTLISVAEKDGGTITCP